MTAADLERFLAKVYKTGDCWFWRAGTSNGYGRFRIGEKIFDAHRLAYEHFIGAIGAGLQIDHLCRNPACVNPEHLEAVTPAENTRRGLRGRLRTHCAQGHELTAENTGRWRGYRYCRTCKRTRNRIVDSRRVRRREKEALT